MKKAPGNDPRLFSWLGLKDVFQTFEDLGSVADKQADIQNIRQLLEDVEDDIC